MSPAPEACRLRFQGHILSLRLFEAVAILPAKFNLLLPENFVLRLPDVDIFVKAKNASAVAVLAVLLNKSDPES